METDAIDGKKTQRTRSIRSKFIIPLCCFGAGSELNAELNINTSDTVTETGDNVQSSESQKKAKTKPQDKTNLQDEPKPSNG